MEKIANLFLKKKFIRQKINYTYYKFKKRQFLFIRKQNVKL